MQPLFTGLIGALAAAGASIPTLDQACRFEMRLADEPAVGSPAKIPPSPRDESFPQADQMPPRFSQSDDETAPVKLGPIWLRPEVLITGDMIAEAHPDLDFMGRPAVSFKFTGEGRQRFAAITSAHVGSRFAIISNGVVMTAPIIEEPITGDGGEISGYFTAESARDLAQSILACRRPP